MVNTFILIFLIAIIVLLGFMFYSFLSKTEQKGKTKIKWKIALYKILQIEFESEHNNEHKSKS